MGKEGAAERGGSVGVGEERERGTEDEGQRGEVGKEREAASDSSRRSPG